MQGSSTRRDRNCVRYTVYKVEITFYWYRWHVKLFQVWFLLYIAQPFDHSQGISLGEELTPSSHQFKKFAYKAVSWERFGINVDDKCWTILSTVYDLILTTKVKNNSTFPLYEISHIKPKSFYKLLLLSLLVYFRIQRTNVIQIMGLYDLFRNEIGRIRIHLLSSTLNAIIKENFKQMTV